MLYGERLLFAMRRRSEVLGQDIARKDVARVAGTSVQNIGVILTNAKGRDQKLRTQAHAAVAAFLKVNSRWLLSEEGPMAPSPPANAPSDLTPAAIELAIIFDMIPLADKLRRAQTFNVVSTAVMRWQAEDHPTPENMEALAALPKVKPRELLAPASKSRASLAQALEVFADHLTELPTDRREAAAQRMPTLVRAPDSRTALLDVLDALTSADAIASTGTKTNGVSQQAFQQFSPNLARALLDKILGPAASDFEVNQSRPRSPSGQGPRKT